MGPRLAPCRLPSCAQRASRNLCRVSLGTISRLAAGERPIRTARSPGRSAPLCQAPTWRSMADGAEVVHRGVGGGLPSPQSACSSDAPGRL